MKIVIDMNLFPQWVEVLMLEGNDCVHWSEIGPPNAPDREILLWARSNGYVTFPLGAVTRIIKPSGILAAFLLPR